MRINGEGIPRQYSADQLLMKLADIFLVLATAILIWVLIGYEPQPNVSQNVHENIDLVTYASEESEIMPFDEIELMFRDNGYKLIKTSHKGGFITYELIEPFRYCGLETIELAESIEIVRNSHETDEVVRLIVLNKYNTELVDYLTEGGSLSWYRTEK